MPVPVRVKTPLPPTVPLWILRRAVALPLFRSVVPVRKLMSPVPFVALPLSCAPLMLWVPPLKAKVVPLATVNTPVWVPPAARLSVPLLMLTLPSLFNAAPLSSAVPVPTVRVIKPPAWLLMLVTPPLLTQVVLLRMSNTPPFLMLRVLLALTKTLSLLQVNVPPLLTSMLRPVMTLVTVPAMSSAPPLPMVRVPVPFRLPPVQVLPVPVRVKTPLPPTVPLVKVSFAALSAPFAVSMPPLTVNAPARVEVVPGSFSRIEPPLRIKRLLKSEFSPLMLSMPVLWLTVTPATRLR